MLQQIERGELDEVAPGRHRADRPAAVAPRPLHGDAAARHRQGPRRRPFANSAPASRTEICPRLGLTPEETETVSWLVLHHLLVSQTAFKRDIEDPKTILDIADLVQSPERLRLLLVLTVCDMRAVGPQGLERLEGDPAARGLLARRRSAGRRPVRAGARRARRPRPRGRGRHAGRPGRQAETRPLPRRSAIPATGSPSMPRPMPATPRMIREAEADKAPLTVRTRVLECPRGHRDHRLCRRPSRACSAASPARWRWPAPRIVDARIHTLTNGMALDTFWVQDAAGGAFDAPHRLARLSVLIEQALSGRLRLRDGDPQGAARARAAARRHRAAARGLRQPRLATPTPSSR